jgi:hypothetical protein
MVASDTYTLSMNGTVNNAMARKSVFVTQRGYIVNIVSKMRDLEENGDF